MRTRTGIPLCVPSAIRRLAFILFLSLCLLHGGPVRAAVQAQVVVSQGDTVGPSTVSTLNSPFTDGNGKVGFVGALADGERFIWWDAGPVFFSNDALPDVLTGGESTMGVSNDGGFIYSPAVNGLDAVYTHGGVLLKKTDPVPPLPGLYSSFNSRPTMLPDGTAFWIGGTATTPNGSTSNRHLFRASDPTDSSTIVRVLGGGDVIEGKTVKTTSSNFTYWISDNGQHHIHRLDMDVPLSDHIYLDGVFVAQQGGPTGDGDNWEAFSIVGVNNSGNYIFTGDTDGDTSTDQFVAYDGVIKVREGDTLDGVTITSGSALRAASINNLDQVAHMWGLSTDEHLFWGEGPDLANSIHILSVGDSIDVDGDFVADYKVTDFNASPTIGPGLDLGDDGFIYLEADIAFLDGTGEKEAILRVGTGPSSFVSGRRLEASPVVLHPVRPNPVKEKAIVRYTLSRESIVRLSLFDINGRRLRTLESGWKRAGTHECLWSGTDAAGVGLSAGSYYLRLETGGAAACERVILLR